jgi:hypothetical protein
MNVLKEFCPSGTKKALSINIDPESEAQGFDFSFGHLSNCCNGKL